MAFEQRNCKKCGRVFTYINSFLCPICYSADEEAFIKVRDFLREFPGSKLEEVSEATGVSSRMIKKFLREERLEILDQMQYFLDCLKCKQPIRSGKYCDKCVLTIGGNVKEIFVKEEPEAILERASMHYASQKMRLKLEGGLENRIENKPENKLTFRDK